MDFQRKKVPRVPRFFGVTPARDGRLSYMQVSLVDPHPALLSARVVTLGASTTDVIARHTRGHDGVDSVELIAHGITSASELRDLLMDYAATLVEGRDSPVQQSQPAPIGTLRVRVTSPEPGVLAQDVIVPGADPTVVLIEDDVDSDGLRRVNISATGVRSITGLEQLITSYAQRLTEGIAP
ncbi:hypothetical protein D9R06_10060 [Kocuria marina subsp. indica]|uniref:hypothetical protein n=1 Tax=Kocuria marina TaxID=223184 RepID=UPI000EF26062|nr:hypothetical protein [Kocuria indica]RLP57314.1 hypothetical protein D9R06_10060 [Kocuria indica]